MKAILTVIILALLTSCDDQKMSQVFPEFKEDRSIFYHTGKTFNFRETRYEEFNIKNELETIKIFLGKRNDTLLFAKKEKNCIKEIIFLPINSNVNSSFYFSDFFCGKSEVKFNDAVGYVLGKNNNITDTVISFMHRTSSSIIYDLGIDTVEDPSIANVARYFILSKKYGIVSFKTKIRKGVDTLSLPY